MMMLTDAGNKGGDAAHEPSSPPAQTPNAEWHTVSNCSRVACGLRRKAKGTTPMLSTAAPSPAAHAVSRLQRGCLEFFVTLVVLDSMPLV
jgi:hypothetical protein